MRGRALRACVATAHLPAGGGEEIDDFGREAAVLKVLWLAGQVDLRGADLRQHLHERLGGAREGTGAFGVEGADDWVEDGVERIGLQALFDKRLAHRDEATDLLVLCAGRRGGGGGGGTEA